MYILRRTRVGPASRRLSLADRRRALLLLALRGACWAQTQRLCAMMLRTGTPYTPGLHSKSQLGTRSCRKNRSNAKALAH
eukprot:6061804-Prymnesium_polylepis.1